MSRTLNGVEMTPTEIELSDRLPESILLVYERDAGRTYKDTRVSPMLWNFQEDTVRGYGMNSLSALDGLKADTHYHDDNLYGMGPSCNTTCGYKDIYRIYDSKLAFAMARILQRLERIETAYYGQYEAYKSGCALSDNIERLAKVAKAKRVAFAIPGTSKLGPYGISVHGYELVSIPEAQQRVLALHRQKMGQSPWGREKHGELQCQ